MDKGQRKGGNCFKGKCIEDWVEKKMSGRLDNFFAELLDLLRRSPSLWRHSQAWTGAGALCGPLYTLASVSKHPLPLLPGSPFSSIILSFPLIVRTFQAFSDVLVSCVPFT